MIKRPLLLYYTLCAISEMFQWHIQIHVFSLCVFLLLFRAKLHLFETKSSQTNLIELYNQTGYSFLKCLFRVLLSHRQTCYHTLSLFIIWERGKKKQNTFSLKFLFGWAHVVILGFICGDKIIVLLEMLSLNGLINKGQII